MIMGKDRKPVRVAVNVMRARQTVIGFNIAIVSFQISRLSEYSGGVSVQGFDHLVHVRADIALYMSLALSLIALTAMTMSSIMDEEGVCTHWSLLIGDVLMYLALAYTLTGFFAPLDASMKLFTRNLPSQAAEAVILQKAVLFLAGVAWFLAMYIGPLASLLRSPFPRQINLVICIAYVCLILVLSWVNAQARMIETVNMEEQTGLFSSVMKELVLPFRW